MQELAFLLCDYLKYFIFRAKENQNGFRIQQKRRYQQTEIF